MAFGYEPTDPPRPRPPTRPRRHPFPRPSPRSCPRPCPRRRPGPTERSTGGRVVCELLTVGRGLVNERFVNPTTLSRQVVGPETDPLKRIK